MTASITVNGHRAGAEALPVLIAWRYGRLPLDALQSDPADRRSSTFKNNNVPLERAEKDRDTNFKVPRRWDDWRLDSETAVLRTVEGVVPFEVDLEGCNTSAAVLDKVAQFSRKRWASDEQVGQLVRAINELLHPQRTLCPWGQDRELPAGVIRHLIGPAE